MSLVSSRDLLLEAQKGGYAVPAFNAENLEMVVAITSAADEERSPVIVQSTSPTARFVGLDYLYAMVSTASGNISVPVALHLDHGDGFALAAQAIRAGYTSVMYDGSKYPFEQNISLTAEVVKMAKAVGVPVEAELGTLGGKEDDIETAGKDVSYTDPLEAAEYAERTGINSLAVAIGTAHGLYKREPKIDFERLDEIRKMVCVPLVLHGGTGIPGEMVQKSISLGICKVNFATELRIAHTNSVRETLRDESVIHPQVYMKAGIAAVKDMVKAKIALCGSAGKV